MEIAEALRWHDSHLNHETSATKVVAGEVEGLSMRVMRDLMALLGDPQDQVPVIHITGTNGKGTVASIVTALLRAHGLTVGTYTSPHLARVNERIARDGEPISDIDLAEVLTGIAAVEPLLDTPLSWFEIITAAAFRHFAEAPVDVAVVEVGLLGRHDATNVVNGEVAVVTSIQGDHTDFVADWEMRVASEKAGIISPDSIAVLGEMDPALVDVFEAEGPRRLVRLGVDFSAVDDRVAVGGHMAEIQGLNGRYDELFLPLHGDHQVANAALAVAAVEAFFERELDSGVIGEAFASLSLPGRFEVLGHGPLVVLDGAHNADAIAAVAKTLDDEFTPVGTRILVFGMLAGRSVARSVAAAAGFRPDLTICVTLPGPRGVDASVIARECARRSMAHEVVTDLAEGVRRALVMANEEDVIVVTGSFQIVEPARTAVSSFLARG